MHVHVFTGIFPPENPKSFAMEMAMEDSSGAACSGCDEGGAAAFDTDALPDSLISLILSKLVDARYIAQASTVCRRWRSCVSAVPVLRLQFNDRRCCSTSSISSGSGSSISSSGASSRSSCSARKCCRPNDVMRGVFTRMLASCSGLRELLIRKMLCNDAESLDTLCGWLRNLRPSLELFEFEGKFKVDHSLLDALSECPKLSSLHLVDNFSDSLHSSKFVVSPDCSPFVSLRTCVLQNLELGDSSLWLLVRLCPVLENLEVLFVHGLVSPTLEASNLLHLKVVAGPSKNPDYDFYAEDDYSPSITCLKINAPKLKHLWLDGTEEAHADGSTLVELVAGSYFRPVFKKTPKLQSLEIAHKGWSMETISEFLSMAKSARKLAIHVSIERMHSMSFAETFEDFTELRTLEIDQDMFESLQSGNLCKTKMLAPPPLRDVSVVAHSGTKNTITLLSTILECGSLSSLKLSLMERPSGTFCTSLLKLQSQHHRVSITVASDDDDDDDDEEDSEFGDDMSFPDVDEGIEYEDDVEDEDEDEDDDYEPDHYFEDLDEL